MAIRTRKNTIDEEDRGKRRRKEKGKRGIEPKKSIKLKSRIWESDGKLSVVISLGKTLTNKPIAEKLKKT